MLRLRQACNQFAGVLAETLESLDRLESGGRFEVPPAGTAGDPVLGRLGRLGLRLLEDGVDPSDAAFAGKAAVRHRELPEDRRGELLGDCARRLDALLWKYHFLLPPGTHGEASALSAELARAAGAEIPEAGVRVPSAEPAGTAVASISPGRRAVSSGRASRAAATLVETARALGAAKVEDVAGRGAALADLMKLWTELADADADKELAVLRYAVNAVHPTGLPLVEPLLGLLRERGISEIPVGVGAPFDDSYSPSRYERRRVPSAAPRNTILRTLQRGFVGPDGTPLQRAVVAVSDGSG